MNLIRQLVFFVALSLLLLGLAVQARGFLSNDVAGLPVIAVSKLPPEARDTLQRIARGGPFLYSRDGVVFGNYERILPQQRRGYYHEYTVPTPEVRHRGARRIVCGDVPECYYTDDHYRSFKRIKE